MSDFVVVGAGVVGTSVAYRPAQAGASVTVLEAAYAGGGTSGRELRLAQRQSQDAAAVMTT